MKKELKDKWVAALRSGEYEQTRNGLLKEILPNGKIAYCCLGVLAKINNVLDGPYGLEVYDANNEYGYGIPVEELWSRNDGKGFNLPHSFCEIADYIEENVVED
jgi:hypothetical protein